MVFCMLWKTGLLCYAKPDVVSCMQRNRLDLYGER